jgi:hypothetical protein
MMVSLKGPRTTGEMVEVAAPDAENVEKPKTLSDIPVKVEP